MKGEFVAAALAALASGVSAAHHRHAHEHLFRKGLNDTAAVCTPGCTTIWKTMTGEPTLVAPSTTKTQTQILTVTPSPKTSTQAPPPPPTTQAPPPPPATTEIVVVPTPVVTTCPTPGTYTFPATTVTIQKTTTVCDATSTKVPSGTHTIGGVTTVVVTATTVTCPVATIHTSGSVTTSTIVQTTYVCPSAGTYTIAPFTTTVSEETIIVYPTPATYSPGTYTAPKQVVTVTKTGFVYICPLTSQGLSTSTPVSTSTPAPAPTSVKTQAPPPPPVKTTEAPKKSEAPKSSQAPPPPNNNGGDLVSNNDHLGMTYTPYVGSTGQCKTADQVDSDISAIKSAGFSVVRVYSTDCNTLENVGNACSKYGMKMIAGVFVKSSGCSINTPDIKEQVDKLVAWGKWDLVVLLVVGNEAIMNNYCSPEQLKQLITDVKGKCSGKFNGKVTISETLNIWQREDVSSHLCSEIDITGANIHPYFNNGVAPSEAGQFVRGQISILQKICNKAVITLEVGWPSGGLDNGLAVVGLDAQSIAVKSIREQCGNEVIFFSLENDSWKQKGSCGCEDSWGLGKAFNILTSS
ncbi:beta-glucosidase, partial [Metarhizium majus ARSEF 297]